MTPDATGKRSSRKNSRGVANTLRTSDVAPWEAPIAVLENHKEASCPVMIDGKTNSCGAPLFAKTVRGRLLEQLSTAKQYG